MQPAQTLADSAPLLQQKELDYGSQLYADLRAARDTDELTDLENYLRASARTPNAFARAAFVGNRGAGKSTFLLNLEHKLSTDRVFTALHIYLDPSLEEDCDYSDLLLWMVDAIAREFEKRGHPVADAELSKVTLWFADKTSETITDWKKEIGLEASAEGKAGTGIPGLFSLKLLARLKSMIVGSETSRKQIRQSVQNYATELREAVNAFLDHARDVLQAAGQPDRLLLVQDNLDRLKREPARKLFETGGEMLTSLRADCLYTAPLALTVAPYDISSVFGHSFTMANVKVRLRNGKPHRPGLDGLLEIIRRRLAIELVFESEKVARYLAEKSGGSVRDLIRLLDTAQLKAQGKGKTRVDMATAKAAVKKLAVSYTRLLLPANAYYPILAQIAASKRAPDAAAGPLTVASVAEARAFFGEMIGNGSVLEYNGDDSWYDVHPAVCETEQFADACQAAQAPTP